MLDTRKYRFVDDLIWIYQSQTDENFCSIDQRGTEEGLKSCENFLSDYDYVGKYYRGRSGFQLPNIPSRPFFRDPESRIF